MRAVIKSDAQTSRRRVASHVLICRNSIRTIIRCARSHVNHSSAPKLFITLCFIYDCIFPCYRKVRTSRGWLAGTELPQLFTETGWPSCAAQAREVLGWGLHIRQTSRYRVESCNSVCKTFVENSDLIYLRDLFTI